MLSSLLAGPVLWYSNRRRCGAWPLFFSPPFWGWVCFGGLTGVVVHLRDAWRGFPRWVGLLAALLEVYLSIFEQLVSRQGASASTPLFPRGKGRGF